MVRVSMTASEMASTRVSPARSKVTPESKAVASLAMALAAKETPSAPAAPPPWPPAMARAAPPESARIRAESEASTVRAPPMSRMASLTWAVTVLVMVLPDPLPAPARDNPPPWPPARAPPIPKAKASMSALPAARSVRDPSASTRPPATAARVVLFTVLTAAAPAPANAVPPPWPPATASEPEPASAVMTVSSVAVRIAAPVAPICELRISASTVLATVLPEPAPAPPKAAPPPCPPAPRAAPARVRALMAALEDAAVVMSCTASRVTAERRAVVVLPTLLDAMESPSAADLPPP